MKNIKRVLMLFFAVIMVFLFSGCWDFKDINEKEIVTAVIFDYKDDEIILYNEIARTNIGNGQSGGDTYMYKIIESRSKNLIEMRENIENKTDKPVYLSGVRVLLLTESFANKYLVEYMYRFKQDVHYRNKINTLILGCEPQEIIDIAKQEKNSIGFVMEGVLKSLEGLGTSFNRSTIRLLENLSSKYTGMIFPGVGVKQNSIALIGYYPLRDDKIVGFIPNEEARGSVLLLKKKGSEFNYSINYEDFDFTLKCVQKGTKIIPELNFDEINMTVKMNFESNILYSNKKLPTGLDKKDYENINNILKDKIKTEITQAIETAQNVFDCDYIQYDDYFRIKYPNLFKDMDWYETFNKITSEIKVDCTIIEKSIIDFKNDEVR